MFPVVGYSISNRKYNKGNTVYIAKGLLIALDEQLWKHFIIALWEVPNLNSQIRREGGMYHLGERRGQIIIIIIAIL